MEYDQKFQAFSSLVLREASEQKQKILSEVKEKITQAQQNMKQEIINKAEQELKVETEKAIRRKNEELSKAAMQTRKILIETREELIGKMHDAVVKRILDFTKSNAYVDFLLNKIKAAKQELKDENVVVYVGSGDKELVDKLEASVKVSVEVDESILLGGCKVVSTAKKMLVDNTLQRKMNEEFSKFDKLVIRN